MIRPLTRWKVSETKVSDARRFSNLVEDMTLCARCGSPYVELHEVFNGSGSREKSKKYGLVIPLCRRCHSLVHSNQEIDRQLKLEVQREFIKRYGYEKYMEVFKKNYE